MYACAALLPQLAAPMCSELSPEEVAVTAVSAEPAPKSEAPAAAKAEAGKEEGGSPLASILGTVLGIIVVAIAAFSSNAKSAEDYEAAKEKAKEKVGAGECGESSVAWPPKPML